MEKDHFMENTERVVAVAEEMVDIFNAYTEGGRTTAAGMAALITAIQDCLPEDRIQAMNLFESMVGIDEEGEDE